MLNVIVPIYKARDTLPQLLNSLVAQTATQFRVVLSQDGDKENYDDIIEEYKRRGLDLNIVTSEKNQGPGLARQFAMDRAEDDCDLFMFCDADDMLNPRAIEILTREMAITNADLIASDFIAEHPDAPGQYMAASEIPVTWCHGKIYRREYLKRQNIHFHPTLRLNEDSYFNLVAFNCTENKRILPEVTYIWRSNPNSLTRQDKQFYERGWLYYFRSQVDGMRDIDERLGGLNPLLVAATLINVYEEVVTAYHLNMDVTPAKEILNEFKQITDVQNALHAEEFWQYIVDHTKNSKVYNDEIIFFKIRFIDFINEYISRLKLGDTIGQKNIVRRPPA